MKLFKTQPRILKLISALLGFTEIPRSSNIIQDLKDLKILLRFQDVDSVLSKPWLKPTVFDPANIYFQFIDSHPFPSFPINICPNSPNTISCFRKEICPILPNSHFLFSGRPWSHIQDFQELIGRIFIICRCPSFPKSSNKHEVRLYENCFSFFSLVVLKSDLVFSNP